MNTLKQELAKANRNLFNIAKSWSVGKVIPNKKSIALKEIDLKDELITTFVVFVQRNRQVQRCYLFLQHPLLEVIDQLYYDRLKNHQSFVVHE